MNRVLLVDRSNLIVEALTRLLGECMPGVVVSGCRSTEEARSLLRGEQFDVVLTQLAAPGVNGLEILRTVRQASPDTAVVFLVDEDAAQPELVREALRAGASGVVAKSITAENLKNILNVACGGAVVVDVNVGGEEPGVFSGRRVRPPLDETERRILSRIALGATTKDAAQALGVSEYAVRNRLGRLYRRLGVRTRSEAVAVALSRGLIDLASPGSQRHEDDAEDLAAGSLT